MGTSATPPISKVAEDVLIFTQGRPNTSTQASTHHILTPGRELPPIIPHVYIGTNAPDLRGPRSVARSPALGADPRAFHGAPTTTLARITTPGNQK